MKLRRRLHSLTQKYKYFSHYYVNIRFPTIFFFFVKKKNLMMGGYSNTGLGHATRFNGLSFPTFIVHVLVITNLKNI